MQTCQCKNQLQQDSQKKKKHKLKNRTRGTFDALVGHLKELTNFTLDWTTQHTSFSIKGNPLHLPSIFFRFLFLLTFYRSQITQSISSFFLKGSFADIKPRNISSKVCKSYLPLFQNGKYEIRGIYSQITAQCHRHVILVKAAYIKQFLGTLACIFLKLLRRGSLQKQPLG